MARSFPTATAFPARRLHGPALEEEMAAVPAEASGRRAGAAEERVMAGKAERAAGLAANPAAPAARIIMISKTACRTAAAGALSGPVRERARMAATAVEPCKWWL